MKLIKLLKQNFIPIVLIIIAVIIFRMVFPLCQSKLVREGVLDMKNLSLVSESDKGIVLNEIVSSINNHDKILSTYDKEYNTSNVGSDMKQITIDGAMNILSNLSNMLPVLNKHEISIQKLSMGLYYPNRTLATLKIDSYKNDAQALQDFAEIVIYHDTAIKKIAANLTQQITSVTNMK